MVMSLEHGGAGNFWGGPTFRAGRCVQLPNDGAMRPESFGPTADGEADGNGGGPRRPADRSPGAADPAAGQAAGLPHVRAPRRSFNLDDFVACRPQYK
jgi:hypothetical protein